MSTATRTREITDATIRRWLSRIRQPDRLSDDQELAHLLEAHERLPDNGSKVDLGHAAADLLREAIDGLEPTGDAPREERLPYEVLTICFIEGAKLFQAANKLGMSERQMTRERTRAIKLLKAELETPSPDSGPRFRAEPIPALLDFLERPHLDTALQDALAAHRLVRVHGAPGVGKTSLVADRAARVSERTPTLWYRFRPGVNDSVEALLFELGEYLRSRRRPDLALYITDALPTPDSGLATRLALKGLSGQSHFLVLDDYHVVDEDPAIAGLLEEAVARLADLRVVTIGRHRDAARDPGESVEVQPFALTETQDFLVKLGVETDPQTASAIHAWTDGVPHLVKLAASWLKTATPSEIEEGVVESLGDAEEVQQFLLDGITELMGPDDRAILEAASVFRGRFTDDALAFVADRTRGEVQDTCRRLVRAYVASRSRGGDVAFFHTSVRDYVYGRLPLDRRQRLHERAGAWFRRQEEDAEAKHHERAARGDQ